MTTKVKRVLVSFGFIFILEAVVAKLTCVLLFELMMTVTIISFRMESLQYYRAMEPTEAPLQCQTSLVS